MNHPTAYLVSTLTLAAVFAACGSDDATPNLTGSMATGTAGTNNTSTGMGGGASTDMGGSTTSTGGTVASTGGTTTAMGGTTTGTGGTTTAMGGTATSNGGATTATGGAGMATAGAGTGMGGSGATAGPVSAPTDTTAAGIGAFLASGEYQMAPWVADSDAPRQAAEGLGSPHGGTEATPGAVRVWFNDAIVASHAAGNGSFDDQVPHTTGSMVVKDLYNGEGEFIGTSAMLKVDGGYNAWTYYCEGPAPRCGESSEPEDHIFTAEDPAYGEGGTLGVACDFCHGGTVFSEPPMGM